MSCVCARACVYMRVYVCVCARACVCARVFICVRIIFSTIYMFNLLLIRIITSIQVLRLRVYSFPISH